MFLTDVYTITIGHLFLVALDSNHCIVDLKKDIVGNITIAANYKLLEYGDQIPVYRIVYREKCFTPSNVKKIIRLNTRYVRNLLC